MAELPEWANSLHLAPHPEGGWYRETWRSGIVLPPQVLPGAPGARDAGSAILFLLLPGEQSAWHTVASDEMWLFHRGGPLALDIGGEIGGAVGEHHDTATTHRLGAAIEDGQTPQALVPAGHWQRARAGSEATLVTCVVVPGFDFADFTLLGPDA